MSVATSKQQSAAPMPLFMTIAEAAKKLHISRQAVYAAVKKKRLTSHRHTENGIHLIAISEIEKYESDRYIRKIPPGYWSVPQIAGLSGRSQNNIYYSISRGILPFIRHKTTSQCKLGLFLIPINKETKDFFRIDIDRSA